MARAKISDTCLFIKSTLVPCTLKASICFRAPNNTPARVGREPMRPFVCTVTRKFMRNTERGVRCTCESIAAFGSTRAQRGVVFIRYRRWSDAPTKPRTDWSSSSSRRYSFSWTQRGATRSRDMHAKGFATLKKNANPNLSLSSLYIVSQNKHVELQ